MQYANPGTGDGATDGTRYERIAPPAGSSCVTGECGIGLWLDPAAFTAAPIYTLGTLPRTLPDLRTPAPQQLGLLGGEGSRPEGQHAWRDQASKC